MSRGDRDRRHENLGSKVYCGGLGNDPPRKDDLEDEFAYYGKVKSVWVARSPPGFAYIEFEDKRDAEDACKGLNDKKICGRRVKVELSNGVRLAKPWDRERRRSRSRSRDRRRRSRSRSRDRRRSRDRKRSSSRDRKSRRDRSRSKSRSKSRGRSKRERSASRSRSRSASRGKGSDRDSRSRSRGRDRSRSRSRSD